MFKLKKILPLILCMLVVYTLFSCEEEEKVETAIEATVLEAAEEAAVTEE